MLKSLTIFIFFLNCFYTSAQVKIALRNDTGEKIYSVKVEGVDIGNIEKDSLKTVTVKSIIKDSGHPQPNISVTFQNEKLNTLYSPCATSLTKMTEGEINRKITIMQTNAKKFIVLKI